MKNMVSKLKITVLVAATLCGISSSHAMGGLKKSRTTLCLDDSFGSSNSLSNSDDSDTVLAAPLTSPNTESLDQIDVNIFLTAIHQLDMIAKELSYFAGMYATATDLLNSTNNIDLEELKKTHQEHIDELIEFFQELIELCEEDVQTERTCGLCISKDYLTRITTARLNAKKALRKNLEFVRLLNGKFHRTISPMALKELLEKKNQKIAHTISNASNIAAKAYKAVAHITKKNKLDGQTPEFEKYARTARDLGSSPLSHTPSPNAAAASSTPAQRSDNASLVGRATPLDESFHQG